ncbi:MAG: hypothetical protein GQ582_01130 [Methyloprofundus sp.]|nr:hypothetical protein [Methyloprofundus sp.]
MVLFLKNIPLQTKYSDIVAFIEPAMKRKLFFGKKGVIENIRFLHVKDPSTNIAEVHGLVTIVPNGLAKTVIKRLNKKKFKSKYIEVREYYQRDSDAELKGEGDNRRRNHMEVMIELSEDED